jgi:hypothetical protein
MVDIMVDVEAKKQNKKNYDLHLFLFSYIIAYHYIDDMQKTGRDLMKVVKVQNDDTIGIAVQQSDLPMVQFLLNGEILYDIAINRFRGMVYPSLYLPESDDDMSIELVTNENKFRQMSPHPRFGPLILARGLI